MSCIFKKSIVTIAMLVLISSIAMCQDKYDYIWLFSANGGPSEGNEVSLLDFNDGKLTIDSFNIGNQIGRNNTSISSKSGELLLYSNACTIYDSTFMTVDNGHAINPGEIHDIWCQYGDYPAKDNSIFLEDPAGNGVYFVHKNIVNTITEITLPDLMYSYIGYDPLKVIEKNVKIDTLRNKISGYMEAIRHQNGIDWWLVDYTVSQDSGYLLKFLLDSTGIFLKEQEVFVNQASLGNSTCSSGGQACFSPDGTKYVKFCPQSGLDVFDFDRSTCGFSNYRNISVPQIPNDFFSGVAISPNGRYVYISNRTQIVQVDLLADNPSDQILLIDTYDGFTDPFPTNFATMQIGPDCRIYMTSTNGVRSLHVINNPDEKGTACNFVQRGLKLKDSNYPVSLPNHPVFRLDGDAVCDPTITNVFDIPVEVVYDLDVYPNPTYSDVTVNVPDVITDGVLSVRSLSGQQLLKQEISHSGEHLVSLANYQNGVYVIELVSDSSVYLGKVVKVE